MKRGVRFLLWTVFCLVVVIAAIYATFFLWNWLIPALFNGPQITFWHAAGLLILSKLLFTGFGKRCHCGGHQHGGAYWKQQLRNRFSNMTKEEREELKRKMKEKWCFASEDKGYKEDQEAKS